jgi:murein DD-endopeptidase MepM/ murein hydrolase activator NlpD
MNMRRLVLVGALSLAVSVFLTQSAGVGRVRAQAKQNAPVQTKKYFNFSPIEVAVPVAPIPVESGGKVHLVYELHITNFTSNDLTLTTLEVLDGASSIATYKDEELTGRLFHLGVASDLPDKRTIGGGMRVIVFMWLTVDKARVPLSLRHQFTFKSPKLVGSDEERSVEGPQTEVRKQRPVVITPPFKDGIWAAGNGPSNTSVHRRALRAVNNKLWIAQRFAFDWFKRGDDGKLVHDDPQKNENWYGYGTELLAVGDGVVSAVKNDIPENVPLSVKRAIPITEETIAGNYVVLDLGHGLFALYGHMQPRNMRVKVGDRVRRGQILGLLGNSGNADSPHLHFQIADGNSPRGAEGLPFVFESYEVLGVVNDLGILTRDNGWRPQPGTPVERRSKEMPLENMILRFP